MLIEKSRIADARMRSFNRDGTESPMAGNNIRCVAKYLYDKGYVRSEQLSIESGGVVHRLKLYLRDGKVSSVCVDMGRADFAAARIPVQAETPEMVDQPITIGGHPWNITCVSVGNPHCVLFVDSIDSLPLSTLGPQFEYDPMFPERVNTEFVRVIDRTTLRLRVWERGNGETLACGTGACAAAAAAVKRGLCEAGRDITVKLPGGDLTVNCTEDRILLTGPAVLVFEGEFEY